MSRPELNFAVGVVGGSIPVMASLVGYVASWIGIWGAVAGAIAATFAALNGFYEWKKRRREENTK